MGIEREGGEAMADAKERADAARKLREDASSWYTAFGKQWAKRGLCGLMMCANTEKGLREGLERLADLIEPDRGDDLLALADELRASMRWLQEDAEGCVRVPKADLAHVESRIREVLEVKL